MSGIVERCLVERFGQPLEEGEEDGLTARRWLAADDPRTSVLYYARAGAGAPPGLDAIYGTVHGGVLAGTSLKLGATAEPAPFGVPLLDEYADTPELRDVLAEEPGVTFFMDAANVYFYGVARGEMVEYDAETGELEPLGPPEVALGEVVDQWLAAAAP